MFTEGLFLRIWLTRMITYFCLTYFSLIEPTICSRYSWLNDGWHCCSSRRPVERYADLLLFVLWSLYIDYHPSKEFSLNSRMLRIKHWLLIINMFHKAVTFPIELEKGFFHVGYNYISLFTNSDHIVIIS